MAPDAGVGGVASCLLAARVIATHDQVVDPLAAGLAAVGLGMSSELDHDMLQRGDLAGTALIPVCCSVATASSLSFAGKPCATLGMT